MDDLASDKSPQKAIARALKRLGVDDPNKVEITTISYAITDLLHLAVAADYDVDWIMDNAEMHFRAEQP